MRELEFNQHNFEVLKEAYQELRAKYEERGAAMFHTGTAVRSLFMPYVRRIYIIARAHNIEPQKAIAQIQDALDELNKHTPLGVE